MSTPEEDSSGKPKFSTSWFTEFVGDGPGIVDNLEEIREFAFAAFDRLDIDGNGFIDRQELVDALTADKISAQEREFLSFLLTNQEQIAESFDENEPGNRDKISRADLETYFHQILSMF